MQFSTDEINSESVIDTVIRLMDKYNHQGCCYSGRFLDDIGIIDYEIIDIDCTIIFQKEDIFKIWNYKTLSEPCGHCGYGETYLIGLTLNNSTLITITNWCGCATYDPSYTVRDFSNIEELRSSSAINEETKKIFIDSYNLSITTKACDYNY